MHMSHHTRILHRTVRYFLSCFFLLIISKSLSAQDGKALFAQNCASCHAVNKDLTGPALKGVEDRWPDKKLLYKWIRNNQEVIKSGVIRTQLVYTTPGIKPR